MIILCKAIRKETISNLSLKIYNIVKILQNVIFFMQKSEPDFLVERKDEKLMEKFDSALKKYGFCIIKNFVEKIALKEKIEKLKTDFSTNDDVRITGPYYYKMKNFQRVDLGDYRQTNARFSRMITQFSWDEDSLLKNEIDELIKFRNEYLNLKKDGLIYEIDGSKFCDLPKILQYPKGGGFMNRHTDDNNEYAVMNILLALSKRGTDYQVGGAYYHDKNGNIVDAEEVLDIGDLYMHDPLTLHGVHAIDPESTIDLNTFSGRIAINLSLQKFQDV